ncbi:sugar transferase [Flavobacteriaceae bacterium]|jgi:undecaprenyl phosphate N,N'-diacetylbacillosamine 1-phosphate transferase|nr:sugar transferase [Flavobacteriaceae bacterium]
MYKLIVKRFLDIVISIFLFPFFLMFLIPVSILILVEDRGAIFYLAERIGKNKVPFKMIKFRSMKVNSPDIRLSDGSTYNSKKDSRVTKIGKIIRELSIDELPQILNVLIGDMSLIGPRPDVFSQEEYPEEYISFLNVKPGITGYNQAYFRNETNRLEKMKNDKYYADNISFLMDLKILANTVSVVVNRKGTYKNNL